MNGRPHYSGVNLGRFAEAVALLVKQPRTAPELTSALGVSNSDQAYRYIRALQGEGLIYIAEWREPRYGKPVAVWAFQPAVCFYSDATHPQKETA